MDYLLKGNKIHRIKMRNLTKTILKETIPILQGAIFGGVGRLTREDWIPILPVAIDLFNYFPVGIDFSVVLIILLI